MYKVRAGAAWLFRLLYKALSDWYSPSRGVQQTEQLCTWLGAGVVLLFQPLYIALSDWYSLTQGVQGMSSCVHGLGLSLIHI